MDAITTYEAKITPDEQVDKWLSYCIIVGTQQAYDRITSGGRDAPRPSALVEMALSSSAPRPTARNPTRAARAAELAAKVIEKHLNPDVPAEKREARRRELLHGPSGFRKVRKDHAG